MADPETVVGLPAASPTLFQKVYGGLSMFPGEALSVDGKPALSKTCGEPGDGLIEGRRLHRDQGVEEVESDGSD
jgi:hypothetical protein